MAHYGLYADWLADLRRTGGQQMAREMNRGAEAYLQMWERAEGVKQTTCRNATAEVTSRKLLGRVPLGAHAYSLLRRAGQPTARPGAYYRWCVKRSKGAVTAAFNSRSRAVLVISTAKRHHSGRVRIGSRSRALRGRAKKLSTGVYVGRRLKGGARRVYLVRKKRVVAVGLGARSLVKNRKALAAALRGAMKGPVRPWIRPAPQRCPARPRRRSRRPGRPRRRWRSSRATRSAPSARTRTSVLPPAHPRTRRDLAARSSRTARGDWHALAEERDEFDRSVTDPLLPSRRSPRPRRRAQGTQARQVPHARPRGNRFRRESYGGESTVSDNLARIMTKAAEENPDGIAVKLDDTEVSYAMLEEGSARMAAILQRQGHRAPATAWASCCPTSPTSPSSTTACCAPAAWWCR